MTLTFELDLDSVMMNQRVECLGRRPFISKVIVRKYTQTHTPDQLRYLDH